MKKKHEGGITMFAMIQTFFVYLLAGLQTTVGLAFFSPDKDKAVDFGGEAYAETVIDEPLTLFEDSQSSYIIVHSDDAEPSVMTGVGWLQSFIAEMTGTELPVMTASEYNANMSALERPYIAVGDTGLDNGTLKSELEKLKDEAFIKRVIGNNIFLCGNGRGTMYSCSSFLEEQLGCRWFVPEVKSIPQMSDIIIDKNLSDTQSSTLEYRDIYYAIVFTNAEWKAFNKINSQIGESLDGKYGGGVGYVDFCHTLMTLLPADKYYETNKEYFSWRMDQKKWTADQRCLTNPKVLEIVTANVIEAIKNAPEGKKIMSVTQEDNNNPCQCENCLAMDEKYGGPSGTNIWFINQIARAVEAEFPGQGYMIDTFAYMYTLPCPSGIEPDDNVIVRMAPIDSCYCHGIQSCDHVKADSLFSVYKDKGSTSLVARELEKWQKIAKHIYVWNYTMNYDFTPMMFPNLHILANNIAYYGNTGVTGIFEQGSMANAPNGEFSELRCFLLAKLLWNPKLNVEHLIDEFLDAYYGTASAPYVKQFIELYSHRAIDTTHLFISQRVEENLYFSSKDLEKIDEMWDKAEELADTPENLRHVRQGRIQVRAYKANIMRGEFSLLNPKRVDENKKLFEDCVLLGMRSFDGGYYIYEPYEEFLWKLRPIEWCNPLRGYEFVKPEKVVPLDVAKYIEEHA